MTKEEPQQAIEHERLDGLFRRRRGVRGIGCAVIILIWLIGSTILWDTSKRNYTIRAQVSQGMSLAFPAKAAVEEYLKSHGELPEDNGEAGLQPPNEITDRYISQVRIRDGTIVVVYGNKAREQIVGKTLMLVPDISKSPDIWWTCTSPDIPDKWLTSMCKADP